MQNVLLLIHLLLTLALIVVVLLQRSEGGGLGMGGGGNGVAPGRAAATALGKLTWGLGISLFVTSIVLTVFAAQNSSGGSVLDRLIDLPPPAAESTDGDGGFDNLLPPPSGDDAPLVPSLE